MVAWPLTMHYLYLSRFISRSSTIGTIDLHTNYSEYFKPREGPNRRPDVQILDKDGKTRKVFEAERHPNSKRNRLREEEYDRLGIEHETHSLD